MTIAHIASPLIMGTQKLKNKVVQENPINPFLMRLPFFKLIVVATMSPFNNLLHYTREREIKGFDQKRLYFD
ncbi:hypothetical protein HPCU_02750 [Helicobacter pylori Cuz20]|uniref:Uncharacterized protein n=1 Tax=Helicobacter pylori (strain Cuz20) TaxID=765964 RepID=A0AB32X748_HELPC|nr:hypothetical protein HPCU_02750 [Helicobacter pylori Cuz20]AFI01105.1 hypothetical protein HPSH112_04530 [Helicobacter pylori Shi112]